VTTLHDFGVVLGWPLDTSSFGLSKFHSLGSWLVCEVALSVDLRINIITLGFRLNAQSLLTILGSIVNVIYGGLVCYVMSMRIFTLIVRNNIHMSFEDDEATCYGHGFKLLIIQGRLSVVFYEKWVQRGSI
jgi:hypothetical protein